MRHTLGKLYKTKAQATSKFATVQQNSLIVQSRVATVSKQKAHLQKQLEHSEQEFQLLQQAQLNDPQSTGDTTDRKQEEVDQLRSRLYEVNAELGPKSDSRQINSLQKQMQEALTEVTTLQKQLCATERGVRILEAFLGCKRRKVDGSIMLVFAASSNQQYGQEVEVTLSGLMESHTVKNGSLL